MVQLREVLSVRKEPIYLAEGFEDWQPITVKFGGDVLPRQRVTSFKGAMFAAYAGDLVFSKIDARNGAVGLIPASIPKAVVTTEYPVMTPDADRLRAEFLHHLLRAGHFKADLRLKASGTSGRKRVTADAFLNLEIPLPSPEQQDVLLARYTAALKETAELEAKAEYQEIEAVKAFEAALGVSPPAPAPERPMFVARFKDLERWSPEGISGGGNGEVRSAKWPMATIGAIGQVAYGILKCPANRPGAQARPYLRVANVQRGFLNLTEIKFINVPDEEMPKYKLKNGDLLLCEGNSPDLVGRGTIWREEIENCVHQNHVLRVRLVQTVALPSFVMAVINSSFGQAYFRAKAKHTTNLASINSRDVSGFPLPLPPLAVQESLVAQLEREKSDATQLRQTATAKRQAAWAAFESALFESDG